MATAGAAGGRPGSPMPVGRSVLGTRWTSTTGISAMRITSKSWKLLCSARPFAIVIAPFRAADRP